MLTGISCSLFGGIGRLTPVAPITYAPLPESGNIYAARNEDADRQSAMSNGRAMLELLEARWSANGSARTCPGQPAGCVLCVQASVDVCSQVASWNMRGSSLLGTLTLTLTLLSRSRFSSLNKSHSSRPHHNPNQLPPPMTSLQTAQIFRS